MSTTTQYNKKVHGSKKNTLTENINKAIKFYHMKKKAYTETKIWCKKFLQLELNTD
jgi:hypothetical protein